MFKKTAKATAYEQAVDELREMHREISARCKFGDARDEKLSKEAYLRTALRNGKTTIEKLDALEKRLEETAPTERAWIDPFLGTVQKRASATRLEDGCMLDPPSTNLYTLTHGTMQQFPIFLMEVIQLGNTTPLELVALGVLRATRHAPDAFGVIEDMQAERTRREATEARWREVAAALPKLAQEAGAIGFIWSDERNSLARVVYAGTTIGLNEEGAAERLVAA